MNVVICDDDLHFSMKLKNIIAFFFQNKSIDVFCNCFLSGQEFLNWCEEQFIENPDFRVDFLFIDMEMPGFSGLDTLRKFREYDKNCLVYIISNHEQFVFNCFEVNTFQYLKKPLSQEKFLLHLERGLKCYSQNLKEMIIYSSKKHIVLKHNEIITVESYCKSCILHTIKGDFITNKKISEFEITLKDCSFLKTHKSFLINMQRVLYYEDYIFFMQNGYTADISHRQRSTIVKKFDDYILHTSFLR